MKIKLQYKTVVLYVNSFLFGAIIVTAFSPIDFAIAAPIAIVVLSYMFLKAKTVKQGLLLGWLAGLGFSITSFYWLFHPVVYVTNSYVLGTLAVIGAVLILSCFFIGIAFFTYFISNFSFYKIVIFNTVIWSSFELLRSELLLGGLPWNIIAAMWNYDLYMMQTASFVGVYGLSFVTYFLCSCLLVIPFGKCGIRTKVIYLGVAFAVLGGFHIAGWYRVNTYNNAINIAKNQWYNKLPQQVAVLQPNMSQADKMQGINEDIVLQNLKNITKAITINRKNLLVIWPETVISNYAITSNFDWQNFTNVLNNNAILVAGILREDANNNIYNSSVILNTESKIAQYYDKQHLVPFGEYIPGAWVLGKIFSKSIVSDMAFSEGYKSEIFNINNTLNFKVLICFEVLFPNKKLTNKYIKMLINISNDGWFDNTLEPYQHLSLARFRSIEGGIPLIRSDNSGISAVVDSIGRIKQYIPMFKSGYIASNIPIVYPQITWFATIGNIPIFLINIFFMIILQINILKTFIIRRYVGVETVAK